jgi:5-methylcytosine-specific restriction endonuclease McrA
MALKKQYKNKTKYSEYLKNPKWQKKRLKIFERDKWKCRLCDNDEITLHIHHLKYQGLPWEVDNKFLITICEKCHGEIIDNGKSTTG